MFVTLTDAKHGIPVLVNLDQVLYAYRQEGQGLSVLVFGKVVEPRGPGADQAARIHNVAVTVEEDLLQIQQQRRMAGG